MGPSLAYSSWILLSDSISLLVLRFLLSEHVSLKLERTAERSAAGITQHRTAHGGWLPRRGHSLAAQEEEVQPQPGEHQHDDGDGETEDEPRAEVDHLGVGVATKKRKQGERMSEVCVI